MPNKIREAVEDAHRATVRGPSLIHDKNATPAEPVESIAALSRTLRPMQIVAERSSHSTGAPQDEFGSVFQRYQTLEIRTGSTMLSQFHPQYLGMAFPYTLPCAVGGIDIEGQERWRRPTTADITAAPLTHFSLPTDDAPLYSSTVSHCLVRVDA